MIKIISIKTRIILLFTIFTILPAILVSVLVFNRTNVVVRDLIFANEELAVRTEVHDLSVWMEEMVRTTTVASDSTSLTNFIEIGDDNVDSEDVDLLTKDFINVAKSNEDIFKIRFIDEFGDEVIRVDSVDGRTIVFDEEDLQNKSNRYYFTETSRLKDGEIFVSDYDLNQDSGEIVLPYMQTIRFGSPLFDEEGEFQGVLIVSANLQNLFDTLNRGSVEQVLLVDQDGQYLLGAEEEKLFGTILETDENLFNEYPRLENQFLTGDKSHFVNEETNVLQTWQKFYFRGEDSDNYWVLVSITDLDTVFSPINNIQSVTVAILTVIAIISVVVALIFAWTITSPIVRLTSVAEKISKGDLTVQIDKSLLTARDEVGNLARAFDRTMVSLKLAMKQQISGEKEEKKDAEVKSDSDAS